MEKINKEELMKKLNLTEEELDKVADGSVDGFFIAGYCSQVCLDKIDEVKNDIPKCVQDCIKTHTPY